MVTPSAKPQDVFAADALHSAQTFMRLLDAAPLGMLVSTLDGMVVYANPAFSDLLGHRPEPGHVFQFADLVSDETNTTTRLHFERLLRGEVSVSRGEHQLRHADGYPVWAMVGATILPADGDTPPLILVQMNSIELQKRAEEALAASESRWNFALESARQGVWDHDIRTDTMFYSRMWRLMRGIPADEAVDGDQAKWLERVHPDDRPRLMANVHRQDRGDSDYDSLEYRERTRDGDYIWILSRGRPVEWDAQGTPIRTIGTDTDITHLKLMEQELAAEKERLRITLEAVADGMISTDLDGRIIFMNPAAEILTGSNAATTVGQTASDVFRLRSERGEEKLPCPVRTCLAQSTQIRIDDDSVLCALDGPRRDIRATASPVFDAAGTLTGAVLVFQDVTQSRALQRQLAHSASHDDLTGLPNRASFERALSAAIVSARHGPREHSLVYLDLDRFKPVNDTAGHAAGDALLKQVAQTIRGVCRSHDLAARIGGDEFAIVLEDCSIAHGREVADKIVRAIGALAFSWAGRDYSIGASAGVTIIGAQPASPLGFMGEADAACYAAKAQGRGCVVAYPEMAAS
ncbi:diguanylate cyclase (GGDEF)-like protein/PAS domain S-box-containing protein [Devosia subaequoris]|uniref:Diguanylate cyclase (GGDEF)-like protein/PAS domain S-box-containing protein n=1 Tax=Devosia subaequoris TaxID=395930 RepID=A0A7W6INN0_9HYPH|nr:diguanylate cyclase [Devosia subaequoris]MBB4052908.1 diguanylate cyclase (GGDEF)-like protein/PAS domain S-box-containing protein [Devosia subaequoris]MCP1210327.1 diguanylate cyclase [Devosia subaequoris]